MSCSYWAVLTFLAFVFAHCFPSHRHWIDTDYLYLCSNILSTLRFLSVLLRSLFFSRLSNLSFPSFLCRPCIWWAFHGSILGSLLFGFCFAFLLKVLSKPEKTQSHNNPDFFSTPFKLFLCSCLNMFFFQHHELITHDQQVSQVTGHNHGSLLWDSSCSSHNCTTEHTHLNKVSCVYCGVSSIHWHILFQFGNFIFSLKSLSLYTVSYGFRLSPNFIPTLLQFEILLTYETRCRLLKNTICSRFCLD